MAATIFYDGFETGALGVNWSLSPFNSGRCSVSTNGFPAIGQWHLVLDDAQNDAVFSLSECVLGLNLANRKNVVLSFRAKSVGNEPNTPPSTNFTGMRLFDGVSVSADGGTTWRSVASLATVGTEWQTFTVTLDSAVTSLGGTFNENFRIRFSAYDNAPAPVDGIAVDEVLVTADDNQRLVVEVPPTIREGTSTNVGYALIAIPSTNTTMVLLTCSISGFVSVPTFVEIPPGQLAAPFTLTAADDGALTTNRTGSITGLVAGAANATASFLLVDDDMPAVSLSLPAQLTEGEFPSSNAVVRVERALTAPLSLSLQAQPFSQLTFPAFISLPAGQTQVVFTVSAFNDSLLDGPVPVTLSAYFSGLPLATASTLVLDNETNRLAFSNSVSIVEGGQATGYVRILGVLPTNLVVSLTTTNPDVTLPVPVVTIPAGALSAPFAVTTRDNSLQDGTRTALITAGTDGFIGATWSLTIRDNEPAALQFSTMGSVLNISQPLSLSLSAVDITGTLITGWSDTVELSIVLPDGSTLSPTPANVTVGSGSNFTLRLPEVGAAQIRIRAITPGGLAGISTPFDSLRVIELPTADVVWDGTRQRLHVSSPSGTSNTNADHVVSIDPFTARIVGRVMTGQSPGMLALTSGGENLYAALDRSASIAKLNPATMTVSASFSLGSDPTYGPLYASDLCAVAGQPDAVVVARRHGNYYSYLNHSIAAYENGVMRPNLIPTTLMGRELEPSAVPNTFFTFNNQTGAFVLRRLRLDSAGLTVLDAATNSSGAFAYRIRADGDRVVADTGLLMDGAQMSPLGYFPTNGVMCPDLAANRVYFLERSSSYYWSYSTLTAYGLDNLNRLVSVSLPSVDLSQAVKMIRWSSNGLAMADSSRLYLLNSSQLVAPDSPAELALNVQAPFSPITTAGPTTTTVTVTNRGPNTARNLVVEAEFSHTVVSADSTNGAPTKGLTNATLKLTELPAGGVAVMNVGINYSQAGVAMGRVSVRSEAVDPDNSNNIFNWFASVGFAPNTNAFNSLALTGNNLLHDPTRNTLWITVPSSIGPPLGRTLVAVDPVTGIASGFLPLPDEPAPKCMALSTNGRYLYVGLSYRTNVLRIDLSNTNQLLIPIGYNGAYDLAVMDGDGTGFLAVRQYSAVEAFDNTIRRTNAAPDYTAQRVERTGIPGLFVGQYGNTVRHLAVGAGGVTIGMSVTNLLQYYPTDIVGSGNLLLASSGQLLKSTNLTLHADLAASGVPCLDTPNRRAFLVSGTTVIAFDTVTGVSLGSLPVSSFSSTPQTCIRWGVDGLAVQSQDSFLHIGRWPGIMPTEPDANADGIPDSWTTNHFGTASFNPAGDDDGDGIPNAWEYFFNTSPVQASASPFQTAAKDLNGQKALRLTFPRRAGIFPQPYAYEWSSNLVHWLPAQTVTESVLSLQSADGASTETVEAVLPATNSVSGFLRLKWLPR